MKTQTTNLTGRALDWAVGVAVGHHYTRPDGMRFHVRTADGQVMLADDWSPTTNWGQLGPIIEANRIETVHMEDEWHAFVSEASVHYFDVNWMDSLANHPDIKVAACRAIVAARLGDTVDVPEVLCQ